MSKDNLHLILKQSITIQFENPDQSMGLQNHIADIFYERLQTRMESLFDEVTNQEQFISIETLEIDCGIISGKHWEEEWVNIVLRKLKAELMSLDKKKISKSKITGEFFYFLEHGYLPWNSSVKTIKIFEDSLGFTRQFLTELLEKLQQPKVIKRLLNQFSDTFTTSLVQAILEYKKIEGITSGFTQQHWKQPDSIQKEKILFELAGLSPPSAKSKFKNLGKTELKQTDTISKIKGLDLVKKDIENDTTHQQEITSFFINNAGLVVLHPFLPAFFENLQLRENNQWTSEEAQHQAVWISQFLAKSMDELYEFDLVLNKLLCGLKPTEVLSEMPEITETIR
ncbi:MAG TPA: contractile injection system tape measure protein, partial [Marinilabiliaceae bacterium]|nr:contractile injection system tape measure protein [Marinilabiliaceae bacterium]